jgi:hypothetical protein
MKEWKGLRDASAIAGLVFVAFVGVAACSSSSTPPPGDGGTSTSSGGGTSSGSTSSGATSGGSDATAVTLGCADGGVSCPSGQQCCSGVPYADEGECHPVCDLKSDRDAKERFEAVDGDEVLVKLSRVPVSRWSYRERPDVRHIGPMAQDFKASFEVGADARTIHGVDANGVALVAIQALDRHVHALEHDVAALRQENARLAARCEKKR